MYLLSVVLLMAVFPIISIWADHYSHNSVPLMWLLGKWLVFWGAGLRLFLAGLRQIFQPRFTSQEIFGIKGDDVLPIVRELGIANLATGIAGLASLAQPSFVFPVAVIAAVFYGIAGVRHATRKSRTRNENIALVSDLYVSIIYTAYIGFLLFSRA